MTDISDSVRKTVWSAFLIGAGVLGGYTLGHRIGNSEGIIKTREDYKPLERISKKQYELISAQNEAMMLQLDLLKESYDIFGNQEEYDAKYEEFKSKSEDVTNLTLQLIEELKREE